MLWTHLRVSGGLASLVLPLCNAKGSRSRLNSEGLISKGVKSKIPSLEKMRENVIALTGQNVVLIHTDK